MQVVFARAETTPPEAARTASGRADARSGRRDAAAGDRRASAPGPDTINALPATATTPPPPPAGAAPATPARPASRVAIGGRRARLLAVLGLACATIAGCGSGASTGNEADPAGVVPAVAPLYAGAEVRPQGSEKANADAIGQALTHQTDPYARLTALLQTPGSPTLTYSSDVAPWLGARAGVFLTSATGAGALLPLLEQGLLGGSSSSATFPFGSAGAQGAVVLDTSDSSKASAFVEQQASRAGAQQASYEGVSYKQTSGGVAFAMVDRFAVLGSSAGVRDVIETAKGGPALTHSAAYSALLSHAPAGTLAHLYSNPGAAREAAGSSAAGAATAAGSSDPLTLLAGSRATNISLVPSSTSLAVFVDARISGSGATPGGLLASSAEGSRALQELPGESWLAAGLGNLGQTLAGDVSGLTGAASLLSGSGAGAASTGTLSLGGIVNGLLSPLAALGADNAQARHDFASWMGSGGIFAGGSGLLDLRGAVVIESKNPTLSRAAVGELAAQLARAGDSSQPISIPGTDAAVSTHVSGLPLELVIANGRDQSGGTKFVLGLGEASVTTALNPPSTMASAPSRAAAASSLGEGLDPSLIFEAQTFLGLLEAVGLTEGSGASGVLSYAHAITTVAGGGHALSGEVERYKLVIGLRSSNG